jgi:hypothetical protein
MLTLNDGRSELWQWDTSRKLTVDAECSQVHFSNKVFGRSIDMPVIDGVVEIPDFLLQTDKELSAWAFVGTPENGYTKISKTFKVNRRNKPAEYVFTPPEQTTLGEIMERLDIIEESQDPDAIKDAVDDYLASNPIQVEETDPTVPDWAKQPTKPKYTAAEVGAIPDTTEIPVVPTKVSAFENDAGYLTKHQDLSGYAKTEDIPDKLPNPNALTFTGAVEGTYDGSSPLTVNIPAGGGGTGGGSVLLDNLTLIESITVAEETQYIYRAIDYSLYKYICFSIDLAKDGQHGFYVGFTDDGFTNALSLGKLYNSATGLVFPLSKQSVFFSWNTGKGQLSQVSWDANNAEGVAFFTTYIKGLRLYNNSKWQVGDVINIYGEARA